MKKKNIIIILLLFMGIAFTIVSGELKKMKAEQDELFQRRQFVVTMQELSTILPYKSKYMGDNSNTINLFYHLPLGVNPVKYQMYPDELTLELCYRTTFAEAGVKNLEYVVNESAANLDVEEMGTTMTTQALIYNSTAAFALIDNLQKLIFRFSDGSYTIKRHTIEDEFAEFYPILNEEKWSRFQKTLEKNEKMQEISLRLLIKEEGN